MVIARNSNLLGKITVLLMVGLCVNTAFALDGSGTEQDPWRIKSLDDFNDFATDANYWDDYTRLETDVNLAGRIYTTAVIAPDIINSNQNYDGTTFTGVFDGNNHKITNLKIDDGGAGNDYLGLFGRIGRYSQISDLGLESGSVSGRYYIGGMVGHNWCGCILRCYSNTYIQGSGRVGVLTGYNYIHGSVMHCYSTGNATGGNEVGGLIGGNCGFVSNSSFIGSVNGNSGIGGLVGINNTWGNTSNCYSKGTISGTNSYAGGLIGLNADGSVSDCYSTVDVSGNKLVGALVGKNSGGISNCFWDINSQTQGVTESIGLDEGTVTNVSGLTTVQMQTRSTFVDTGWDFIGERQNGTTETWKMPDDGGYPVLSFFNMNIPLPLSGSGTVTEPYLITDANELGIVSWYPERRYFKLTNDIDLSGIHWSVAVVPLFTGFFDGGGYKVLNMHISGCGYLGLFGYLEDWSSISNLCIDNSSISGISNCIAGLVGVLTGSVLNCYSTADVSGDGYVGGLVGRKEIGSISNCYSTGYISGSGRYVGGLMGYNYGHVSKCFSTGFVSGGDCVGGLMGENGPMSNISNCYANGDVNGVSEVGGLVGNNNSEGNISNCYANGDVNGVSEVGGLVGQNLSYGSISNCYATGDISGDGNSVGGLIGENGPMSNISNCYANGDVSGDGNTVGGLVGCNVFFASVSNSFWDTDTQTHGVTESIGNNDGTATNVAGLPTAQMQTKSTFINAGWDFIGETDNGPQDIWTIHETVDYPKFVWELVNFIGWYEVDFLDYVFFANHWQDSNCGVANDCDGADLDFSDKVDGVDLKIFFDHWLKGVE